MDRDGPPRGRQVFAQLGCFQLLQLLARLLVLRAVLIHLLPAHVSKLDRLISTKLLCLSAFRYIHNLSAYTGLLHHMLGTVLTTLNTFCGYGPRHNSSSWSSLLDLYSYMCAGIRTTQEIRTEDLLETPTTETRLIEILHHSGVTHTQEIQDVIGREAAVPVADTMISHSCRSNQRPQDPSGNSSCCFALIHSHKTYNNCSC